MFLKKTPSLAHLYFVQFTNECQVQNDKGYGLGRKSLQARSSSSMLPWCMVEKCS